MSAEFNKFNKVNIKTILLVCGYIRILEIQNHIIPTSIINLLIKFFHSSVSKIVAIVEVDEYGDEPPQICIADISSNKRYQCNVKVLDSSSKKVLQYQVKDEAGICYIEDFDLPSHVFEINSNLNPSNLYDVIFVVQRDDVICNGYIIDSVNNINESVNAYYWELPSFAEKAYGQTLFYSSKHGLVSVGDDNGDNNLTVLKFRDNIIQSQSKWKWQNIGLKWSRDRARCVMSAAMLTDDKLICCGGDGYEKNVDVFDFVTQNMTTLANMNNKRTFAGICIDDNERNHVYIGGGDYSSDTFECYNVTQNKWTSLCSTNNDHQYWPIIWKYDVNIIIIGSIYKCKSFERIDVRENKWTDYMINGNTFDTLFATNFDQNNDECRLLLDSH